MSITLRCKNISSKIWNLIFFFYKKINNKDEFKQKSSNKLSKSLPTKLTNIFKNISYNILDPQFLIN